MNNMGNTYKPSLYDRIKDNGYNYANIIIPELQKKFEIKSVLDVGCGGASFLRSCFEKGFHVFGVDGEHVKSSLQIDPNSLLTVNLEEPLDLKRKFDLCVSLEVAEHLDEKFSGIFIDSICRHSNNVLFSAAIVGQGGVHHVNCQPLEYWQDKFSQRGYAMDIETTEWIHANPAIYIFYRKNSMVFNKI
jgi:cyclopropane fatty-acyl-phospholipid synthase-like methyltransferase